MGFFRKPITNQVVNENIQEEGDGCTRCGELEFEYDSYFDEYICTECGWTVKNKPLGDICVVNKPTAEYHTEISGEEGDHQVKDADEPSTPQNESILILEKNFLELKRILRNRTDEELKKRIFELIPHEIRDTFTSIDEVQGVISGYGKLIEDNSDKNIHVSDESNLPHPKEKIKLAIIIGLLNTDDHELYGALRDSYYHLSQWQKDVGEDVHLFDTSKTPPWDEIDKANDEEERKKIMGNFITPLNKENKWNEIVLNEMYKLRNELFYLGLL